jgi:beta-lactamase superfamily II metal-dependent hydrolase
VLLAVFQCWGEQGEEWEVGEVVNQNKSRVSPTSSTAHHIRSTFPRVSYDGDAWIVIGDLHNAQLRSLSSTISFVVSNAAT